MSDTIKPFDAGGYFPIHNYVFDVCMRELSNAGWRILCVAIRNTWGWIGKEEMTAMGRKKWDQISYSQFQEMSGLKSPSSVSRGIQECIERNYLIRRKSGFTTGIGSPIYAYALNVNYEIPATDSVAGDSEYEMPATPTVAGTPSPATLTVVGPATLTVDTKVNKKQMKDEKKEDPIWQTILGELALQMTRGTFDQWLRGSQLIATDNGAWTVKVKSDLALEWLDKRLRPTIQRTVERHAPGVEVRFVA